MSSIVFLTNKKNGKIYAYVNEKAADADGKPVYKRRCIGHLDPHSGEIVPNRPRKERQRPKIEFSVTSPFVERLAQETGLKEALIAAFPDSWAYILACVSFCIFEGKKLSDMETAFNEKWPSAKNTSSFLKKLNEGGREAFFRVWRRITNDSIFIKMPLKSFESFDDRGFDSYVKGSQDSYNQMCDYEVILGIGSRLPVYFERHSVAFSSVKELFDDGDTIERMDGARLIFAFDESCGSDSELRNMIDSGVDFITEIKRDSELFKMTVPGIKEKLQIKPADKRGMVSITLRHRIGKRTEYTHIYYDPESAEKDAAMFLRHIERCRSELSNGHFVLQHMSTYRNYLLRDRAAVDLNSKEIMKRINLAGYSIIETNCVNDAQDALNVISAMKEVRKNFDDIMNEQDTMSLKLYLGKNAESRYFIQFIVLILRAEIRRRLEGTDISVDEAVNALRRILEIDEPSRKNRIFSYISEHQKTVLRSLGLFDIVSN